eukprot:PITA_05136
MEKETNSLQENKTWEFVNLPKGRKALQNKRVYKIKHEGDEKKERVILGLVAALDLECEQLDVKTSFLNGELEEEIYMEQPKGFIEKGKEGLVCRLKKTLYGLKQAPQQWYKKFDSFMLEHGFQRLEANHCVYIKRYDQGKYIILLLYVDDMLIVGYDKNKIIRLKKDLGSKFSMKVWDQHNGYWACGLCVTRKKKRLWLSQEKYIKKVLDRFNMKDAKPVGTPLAAHFKLSTELCPSDDKEKEEMSKIPYASIVGSLMYAMVCTRPDIAYSMGVVSRFLTNPGKQHWQVVKWILRYLKGTSHYCLCFGHDETVLEGVTDADMAGDMDTRKSIRGCLYTFAGAAVSWVSRLQRIVALSTTEA